LPRRSPPIIALVHRAVHPGAEGELDADKLHETMAHPLAVGEEMEALPI